MATHAVSSGNAPQIDAKHPSYDAFLGQWVKQRDAVAGEDAVKAAGARYLPMLSGQESDEYEAYKMRAMFYGASDRTVRGLAGAVMRKPPTIEFGDEDKLKTIGINGESIELIARQVLEEVLGVGRIGVLVDAAVDDGGGDGLEPYVVQYIAENCINWQTLKIDGRMQLTQVVLREEVEELGDDGYAVTTREQFRVLRLGHPEQAEGSDVEVEDVAGDDDVYYVELWIRRESDGDKSQVDEFELQSVTIPLLNGGNPLTYIPFVFINTSTTTADVEKGPILDLVNVNMSHYRTSADLEHGRHFTALPTAWVAGFDTKTSMMIGSSVAWVAEDPNAKAGFLEFSGAGLSSLSDALKEKENLMAVLGARLLEEQPKGVEAAETVKLRHAGEQSVLASIAQSVSEGLTTVLQWVIRWGTAAEEATATLELNKDYNVAGIDPSFLTALMGAVQGGMMSWSTWFYNLKKGEIYPDSLTEEDEIALIEVGVPVRPPTPEEEQQAIRDDEMAAAQAEAIKNPPEVEEEVEEEEVEKPKPKSKTNSE